MAGSRDHRRAGDARPEAFFWDEWFARQAPATSASENEWRALARDWHAAVDGWWSAVGGQVPAAGLDALRRCSDQGKVLFELADGVSRSAGASVACETDHTNLWRLPLEMWQRATGTVAGAVDETRAPYALEAYRQALADYTQMLRGVGLQTLGDVADAWQARREALAGDAGLRALFDACVELGERRYQTLVSSEAFAVTGGRLVNAFVELLAELDGAARREPAPAARRPREAPRPADERSGGRATDVDPMTLMKRLGIAPETTLAELRIFGEKLNLTLAALRDVGSVDVGTSAREVVLRDGKLTLFRYRATAGASNPVPVLIVYALANRPYMMDLEPKRSMIRALLDEGLDVYLIDWGYPDDDDKALDLADYVDTRIGKCVQAISDRHAIERISLLGVCQGGTFSLCYAALHPEKVRNLVLMVTPVDFHTPDNLLSAWLRHVDVDRMVDVMGNVPGTMLNWAFVSMKPLRLTGQKYLDMLDLSGDPQRLGTFLRMEKWIHDSPDQAGECFREFAKELMQQNKLVDGTLRIGGRRIDLGNIGMPVLNVYASEDHIVPPAAALALGKHVSSDDYSTLGFDGGHIGIYVSERAQREVPPEIARWLRSRCGPIPK